MNKIMEIENEEVDGVKRNFAVLREVFQRLDTCCNMIGKEKIFKKKGATSETHFGHQIKFNHMAHKRKQNAVLLGQAVSLCPSSPPPSQTLARALIKSWVHGFPPALYLGWWIILFNVIVNFIVQKIKN